MGLSVSALGTYFWSSFVSLREDPDLSDETYSFWRKPSSPLRVSAEALLLSASGDQTDLSQLVLPGVQGGQGRVASQLQVTSSSCSTADFHKRAAALLSAVSQMSFQASESSPRRPQCLASPCRTFPRLMVKNEAVFRCRNSRKPAGPRQPGWHLSGWSSHVLVLNCQQKKKKERGKKRIPVESFSHLAHSWSPSASPVKHSVPVFRLFSPSSKLSLIAGARTQWTTLVFSRCFPC